MAILVRNVQIFTGGQVSKDCFDVLIDNHQVTEIVPVQEQAHGQVQEQAIEDRWASAEAANGHEALTVIDGSRCLLAPGFIDMHVHLREPGFEHKETIASGSLAAAKGGFTSVCCMPNTQPVVDNRQTVEYIMEKAKANNGVDVHVIGAISIGELGEKLTDFSELKKAGIIALSDDGRGVQNGKLMLDAFQQAAEHGLPVIIHAEDELLAARGHIHDGTKAKMLGITGIPSVSESVMVARDILLAKDSGCHVHFAHMSAKESIQWIGFAKQLGIRVTCEVTPQHLVLTDEDIPLNHGNYKVNPPLRSYEDREVLREAFRDGVIDIIATDHAPHTEEEKSQGIVKSPFGMVGLETAFPVLYTHLVQPGIIQLERLLDAMTNKPAELFGIECGSVQPGGTADFVLLDLQTSKAVEASDFVSKGKNSPFIGDSLCGWPILTIKSGEIIYSNTNQ